MKPRLFKSGGRWLCFSFVGMLRVRGLGASPREAFDAWDCRMAEREKRSRIALL